MTQIIHVHSLLTVSSMWPLYPSYLYVALMLGSEHEWVVGGLEGFGHKGGWPDKSCTIYGHLHGPFVTRLVHLDTQNGHFAAATKDIITVFTHKLTPSSSFPLENQAPKNPTKPTRSAEFTAGLPSQLHVFFHRSSPHAQWSASSPFFRWGTFQSREHGQAISTFFASTRRLCCCWWYIRRFPCWSLPAPHVF